MTVITAPLSPVPPKDNAASAALASASQPDATAVTAAVSLGCEVVAPLWPLQTAIAVNPLAGFEDTPFETALTQAEALFGARRSLPLAQWRALLAQGRIDAAALSRSAVEWLGGLDTAFATLGPDVHGYDLLMARLVDLPAMAAAPAKPQTQPGMAMLARWLAAFFDETASPAMAGRQRGLYAAVRAALLVDRGFAAQVGKQGMRKLADLPDDATQVLIEHFAATAPTVPDQVACVQRLATRLPGWTGHLRWRVAHADAARVSAAPASLTDLVALVLAVELATGADAIASPQDQAPASPDLIKARIGAMLACFGLSQPLDGRWTSSGQACLMRIAALEEDDLGLIFQRAGEIEVSQRCVPALRQASANQASAERELMRPRPAAQLVFCIDVRSEPLRHALEQRGTYETLGYAGFFGLPVALQPAVPGGRVQAQLPVLLDPAHALPLAPAPGCAAEADKALARTACKHDAAKMFGSAKVGATAFAMAEATGPALGLAMLARSLTPRLFDSLARQAVPDPAPQLAPDIGHSHDAAAAMTLDQRVGYAQGLFRLTGLRPETARLVALVGHGGCTTNNAFASSLDCGACGGHAGGPNARLLATICNDPAVRADLAERGIALPADSWFIAMQHDTTRDEVTLFDHAAIPASHRHDVDKLLSDLAEAGAANRARRAALLNRQPGQVLTGAVDWAEARPEWGLSGNGAFIIGKRALTTDVELDGTTFLHSYDWQQDAEGAALTTILTAPVIVAQWINCQYLFSTVDNAVFGAGDKTTQNVVSGIGVLQGGGGDLRSGLPWQSLFADDGTPFHVPRRLTVFVHAPPRLVERIVMANDAIGRLAENGWINLVVIDPWKHVALHWQRGGFVPQPQ